MPSSKINKLFLRRDFAEGLWFDKNEAMSYFWTV